jgi:hypothetical protein
MTHKVKFTHNDKSRAHIGRAKVREGKEVYRHPAGRFVVLEFQGKSGKFRESFRPEEIMKTGKVEGLKWLKNQDIQKCL